MLRQFSSRPYSRRREEKRTVSARGGGDDSGQSFVRGPDQRMGVMLLAGDVGGTKTTLGLFPFGRNPRTPQVQATFPSSKYPDLESMVRKFLAQNRASVRYA